MKDLSESYVIQSRMILSKEVGKVILALFPIELELLLLFLVFELVILHIYTLSFFSLRVPSMKHYAIALSTCIRVGGCGYLILINALLITMAS